MPSGRRNCSLLVEETLLLAVESRERPSLEEEYSSILSEKNAPVEDAREEVSLSHSEPDIYKRVRG